MKQIVDYYKSIGQKDKAFVLEKVFESESPEMCAKLKCVIEGKMIKENVMDPIDATAYLLRCDLTQEQYQTTKNLSDAQSAHFLPSYKKVQAEKKNIYPDKMEFSENKSNVALESLMNKIFARIMKNFSFKSITEKLIEN